MATDDPRTPAGAYRLAMQSALPRMFRGPIPDQPPVTPDEAALADLALLNRGSPKVALGYLNAVPCFATQRGQALTRARYNMLEDWLGRCGVA